MVEHEVSGLVAQPEPRAIAFEMSRIWNDRGEAERMGQAAKKRVDRIDLSWDKVLENLLHP